MNPRNESTIRIFKVWSHESGFANPDSRIRILRICKDSDSQISIFKDSFCAIVLRIRWIRKNRRIFWKSVYETNPRNESFENMKDSWSMIRNESGFVNHEMKRIRICQSRNETNLFGVRIRDYDTKRIHGFAKQIHVFTNLLYESRILK